MRGGPARGVVAVLAVAAVVLLAGCGGKKSSSSDEASKSATQILADVKSAVAQAKSVHISGAGSATGTKIALDLTFETGAHGGASGHLTLNGLGVDIVRVNGKTYVKGQKFLEHYVGAAAQVVGDRWIYVPDSVSALATFNALLDLKTLMNEVVSVAGKVTKGPESKVDGQPVIALDDAKSGGTLYVATSGPAYPVELRPGKGNSGAIRFQDWDKPVTLTAPKNALDASSLLGG